MKFDGDDKNICRLVCVKFHLNRCRFAVAVAKCLGGSLFWDTVYIKLIYNIYRIYTVYISFAEWTCVNRFPSGEILEISGAGLRRVKALKFI